MILFFLLSLEETFFEFQIPFKDTFLINIVGEIDKPAGKYGFIKINEKGEFVFENNNKKIRFFGAQIFYNDPDYSTSDIISAKFSQLGFNVWKWGAFELFWNESINSFNWKEKIKRFDYLFFKMKERGLYCYAQIDEYGLILPSKLFKEANEFYNINDIFLFPDDYRVITKGIQYIMETSLFEAQKKYWSNIFNHTNEFTGLKYKDEPAIAICELANENFLLKQYEYFGLKWEYWPEKYKNKILLLWNNWLLKKYGNVENLTTNWQEKNKINILPDENFGNIKLYPLKFNDTTYSLKRRMDIAIFLFELQKEYFDSCIVFLRELGVKCPIIVSNDFEMSYPNKYLSSLYRIVDTHVYFNHPDIIGSKGAISNENPFKKQISIVSATGMNAILNSAIFISEVNWSFPSEHQYLFLPFFASYAAYQDWNAFIIHAFCGKNTKDIDYIEQQLVIGLNPLILIQCFIASKIFLDNYVSTVKKTHILKIDKIWNNYPVYLTKSEKIMSFPYKYKFRISFDNVFSNSYIILDTFFVPENKFISSNRQLCFDRTNEIFIINTEFVKSINGKIPTEIEISGFRLKNYNDSTYGSVSLLTLDKKPIFKSKRLLLIVTSKVRNSKSEWEIPGKKFSKWGSGPVLVNSIKCSVSFKSKYKNLKCYALSPLGEKIKSINVSRKKSLNEIKLYENTLWYLIESD